MVRILLNFQGVDRRATIFVREAARASVKRFFVLIVCYFLLLATPLTCAQIVECSCAYVQHVVDLI